MATVSGAVTQPPEEAAGHERFFFGYMLLLFLIVVIAFPLHALVNGDRLPPLRPVLHLHAITMGAWYALTVVQSGLIQRDNRVLHRKLGSLSPVIVIIMLATGIFVSTENAARTGHSGILLANSIASIFFVIFYGLALLLRQRSDWHKRFMAYGALTLMGPAFGRVSYIFDLSSAVVFPMILSLMLAIPIYDWRRYGRVTRPGLAGLGIFLLMAMVIGAAINLA